MADLYQRGSCINSISSASPRHSPAAPHPGRPHALRDKHSWDAAWTPPLPSTLYLDTSCTQTLHEVNTQGVNTERRVVAQTDTEPDVTFRSQYLVQTMFPKKSNGSLGFKALWTGEFPEMEVMRCSYCKDSSLSYRAFFFIMSASAQIANPSGFGRRTTAPIATSLMPHCPVGKPLLFSDRTDVPRVESSDLKRGPG